MGKYLFLSHWLSLLFLSLHYSFLFYHLWLYGNITPTVDIAPHTLALTLSRSELIRRLNSGQCEYCETTQGPFEVHHVRKLKEIEPGKTLWQRMMIARRRKTLILCQSCHHLL
ncbi:MAG TPA: hypothetical protein VK667_04865, partial [Ktedonobacteraceae bacterium]|nr:hypothetical protein [Ktedonobacteraceae bacterium]